MARKQPRQERCARRAAAAGVSLAALALTALPALARPAAASDEKAVTVAERVMQALGGEAAWKRTRYLRFDFAVEKGGTTLVRRAHTWDMWSGRYRVEGKDEKGRPVLVLMNLKSRDGRAWVGGKALAGDALARMLESAFAWWTNDSYWLLMPYKMRDPGVNLSWIREDRKDGDVRDVVLMTFDKVGLTPKDRYWVFVSRKTGLVEHWEFVLKGADAAPTPFDWKGWKLYGDIRLADDRVNTKDGTRVHFPVLAVPASVDDTVFAQP